MQSPLEAKRRRERAPTRSVGLNPSQREILKLVTDGLSNAQIAKEVFLSESTVKQHLRCAYKVLGVNNHTQAAELVREAR